MSRHQVRLGALLVLALACAVSAQQFGTNDYVSYVPGSLPIVLTVPHGGSMTPAGIPDRTAGCGSPCTFIGCAAADPVACPVSTLKDLKTSEFAAALSTHLATLTGGTPHVVENHLHRSKLDANRDVDEAAQGNIDAETAYMEYFDFVRTSTTALQSDCGVGVVFDIHGHAHPEQLVELGYLVSGSTLGKTTAELNAIDTSTTSMASLLDQPITAAGSTLTQVLRGSAALGTLLEEQGVDSVPSRGITHPTGSYFSGGYTTRIIGTDMDGDAGGVDAIQIEMPSDLRADDTFDEAASKLAAAIVDFFRVMYAIDLTDLSGCPNQPEVCPDAADRPSGAYWFNGGVWDDACSVLLHGACPPADSSAQMVYSDPDSGADVTLYRRLESKQSNMQREDPRCQTPPP